MSLRSHVDRPRGIDDALAVKLAIPLATLLLLPVWLQILGSVTVELDRHLLDLTNALQGWATAFWAVLHLVFLVAFVAIYVRLRSVDVSTGLPDRASVPLLVGSVLVPVGLVAVIAAVSTLGDAHYVIVSGSAFPWFTTTPLVYVLSGLWLLVGVVTAVGLFHVVLQSELRGHVSPTVAIGATTAAGGLVYATQGLSMGVVAGGRGYPLWGEYLALIALVATMALAVGGATRAVADWQRYAALLPLGVVVVGTVAQFLGVVDTGAFVGSPVEWAVPGLATVLFGLTAVLTVGLAAAAYERTESLLAPTLVYAATYLASAVAVLVVAPALPL